MKSKILLCLVLASCLAEPVSDDKVKDRYTDIVKSTEYKGRAIIKKDDVYLCDYRYDKIFKLKKYFRYCDKDGKPLNNTVELESGNYRGKYELRDGFIYLVMKGNSGDKFKELSVVKDADVSGYSVKEYQENEDGKILKSNYYSEDFNSHIHKDYCPDGKIGKESIIASNSNIIYVNIYNEVKKDGVKLNTPLIKESISAVFEDNKGGHFINGEKVLDGYFEISMCGNLIMSYTLKNGKYDGDYVSNDSPYYSVVSKYKNGELLSSVQNFKNEHSISCDGSYFAFNKYEKIKDGDKYLDKYYLDDKFVCEGDWGF